MEVVSVIQIIEEVFVICMLLTLYSISESVMIWGCPPSVCPSI